MNETSVIIEILKGLAQGGPVALIAFYALWAIGKKIDSLVDSISKLNVNVGILLDRETRDK